MAIDNQIADREYQKFVEDSAGDVAVRTKGTASLTDSSGESIGTLNIDGTKTTQVTDIEARCLLQDIKSLMERLINKLEPYLSEEEN